MKHGRKRRSAKNTRLFRDLAGIGVEISAVRPNRKADIERTLLVASMYVDSDDHRILGFLASWASVHGGLVCVGKLRRLMAFEGIGDPQVVSALAFVAVESRFHEWRPLAKKFPERELWKNAASALALKMKGVEPLLQRAGLLLPKGFLRMRSADILPIERLSRAHRQARLRLIFGANLRADAIYYLSLGVKSASDLMRKIGCSYEPAHRIVKELRLAGTLELPRLHLPQGSGPQALMPLILLNRRNELSKQCS